jgi:hypothetical protein
MKSGIQLKERIIEQPSRFNWITASTQTGPVLNGAWLIKGVLPKEGIVNIYGQPGSGKTFVVMDISLHVGDQTSWRGHKVTNGPVTYIASEGGLPVANRVHAWCQHYKRSWPVNFRLSPTALDLRSNEQDCRALIADIRAHQPGCRLVVIDTLSRNMGGGSDNSPEDMGAFIRLCDIIAKELSCCVLIIHHSGKQADKGSRGHSSLKGAVDTEAEVSSPKGQPGTLRITKQRDGEDGQEFGFSLLSVHLGVDEDGDDVKSCVAVEADSDPVKERQKLSRAEREALTMLEQCILDKPREMPRQDRYPKGTTGALLSDWREYCYRAHITASDKPDAKRKAFNRALNGLKSAGKAAVWGDYAWLLSA